MAYEAWIAEDNTIFETEDQAIKHEQRIRLAKEIAELNVDKIVATQIADYLLCNYYMKKKSQPTQCSERIRSAGSACR